MIKLLPLMQMLDLVLTNRLTHGSREYNPSVPVIESFSPSKGFDRNQLFVAQTRYFLETVRGEVEPVCSLEDGIRALELALAAIESQTTSIKFDF